MKKLGCLITQNIDNLHQDAGSVNVVEYHGNVSSLECLQCGQVYGRDDFDVAAVAASRISPLCKKCGAVLKPTVVLFGESIPREATVRSEEAARKADVVLVIGTSAVVYPAAGIPAHGQAEQGRYHRIQHGGDRPDIIRDGYFHQGKDRRHTAGAGAADTIKMTDHTVERIRLLPDSVKKKIAAGEVVEGPFSVIKELVENSIDAGASHVDVQVLEGGLKKITVRDDGRGMHRDDVPLAVMEHATSKIEDIHDIESISSYGFRGEALSSISSVSRLTILSRRGEEETGARLTGADGRVEVGDYAGPAGTTIIVENLFYNVPARKKFLKSVRTETRLITGDLCKAGDTPPGDRLHPGRGRRPPGHAERRRRRRGEAATDIRRHDHGRPLPGRAPGPQGFHERVPVEAALPQVKPLHADPLRERAAR